MLGGLTKQLHHVALGIGLLVLSAFMLNGYRQDSPTEDELTHMVRGIAYWRGADTRLSYAHPPLGNAWTALPVAWDAGNPDINRLKGWKTATASTTTKAYVDKDYGYAREQLMRARLAGMTLGLLLVAYVYYFCLSIFGLRTALVTLALLTLNPVLIAQCRYVTTDPAAMLGFSVAIGELVRYLRGARWGALRVGLGLSLAMLTKYSGVTLAPFSLVTALVCCFIGLGIFADQPKKQRFLRLAQHTGLIAVCVLLCVNWAYRFELTGLRVGEILDRKEPSYWVSNKYPQLLERFTPLPKLPRALPVPLPYTYLFGIAGIRGHASGGFTSYFWGEQLRKAPPIYYPVMLAIKNPPGLLLLLGAAGVLLALKRRLSLTACVLSGAVAAFVIVASRSNLAMGVRHLLPVIPPLSMLAARAFDVLWQTFPLKPVRWSLAALLGSLGVSAVSAGPDYLGYFNIFAGGRKGGHLISIYGEDWGQDRQRFVELVQARNLQPLYYDSQTQMRALEVRFLGLKYRPLRCNAVLSDAWVALHALSYRTRDIGKCYPYLLGREPDLTVNDHVYLWKVSNTSAAPAALPHEPTVEDSKPEARPEAGHEEN
jgi:4-amino-4-deoxy-L-arabinose transferase-like glycosyltransferase